LQSSGPEENFKEENEGEDQGKSRPIVGRLRDESLSLPPLLCSHHDWTLSPTFSKEAF